VSQASQASQTTLEFGGLAEAFTALRKDLLAEGGPQISTMRNYRFAIVPYDPSEEFKLRRLVHELTMELGGVGWNVLPISLQQLLLERLRKVGPDFVAGVMDLERRLHQRDPARALAHLNEKIAPHLEGPNGIAADVARVISEFVDQHPDQGDRAIAFVGRAGALYPFFRTSALLKHIDGRTRGVPVVLLYPGKRRNVTALSFMGELEPVGDYRPRIYP
jgi:hypothetical protein